MLATCSGFLSAAPSYFAIDAHTGKILYAENENQSRPVASLVKIATAMVVFDWAGASKKSLSQEAIVSQRSTVLGGANPMNLRPGDRIKLREALYSMLLGSDNVSAQTLAEYVGQAMLTARGQQGDPVRSFISEMNELARGLGMSRTSFANVHGMDLAREKSRSTAREMALLSAYAMKNSSFAFYVKQKHRRIGAQIGGQLKYFKVANENKILGQAYVNGLKPGMTPLAGQCLALSSEKPAVVRALSTGSSQYTPRRMVVIVLGSADRYGDGLRFVQHGWQNYASWQQAGYLFNQTGTDRVRLFNPFATSGN